MCRCALLQCKQTPGRDERDPFSGQTAARAEVRRSDVNGFCVALCLSRKPSVYASHWACLRNCQTRVHCSTLRVNRPHSRNMANQQDDFDDLAVDAHTQRERDIEKCAAHRCAASIFSWYRIAEFWHADTQTRCFTAHGE